ncbi:hypothetical protein KR222_003558 [Zaprionus bogoriensis]|nr:hypothetical protein KR222_003558 [Zaprionus bogoriensis]
MGDPAKYDPLELLTNRGNRQPSFLSPIWNPLACAAGGFGIALFVNLGFRKPIFSGIQKHILFTAAGGAIGSFLDKKRDDYAAKRDAVLRHYVELHPDDFPVTGEWRALLAGTRTNCITFFADRKKYGEVLESWVPIR